jgi:hypothetical protein
MTIQKAADRLREMGAVPVLAAALLLTASSAWAADHGGHSGGGSHGGGGGHAHSSGGPSSGGHSGSGHSGGGGDRSSGRTGVPSGPGGSGSGHHGPDRQPSTWHGRGGDHGGRGFGRGGGYYPGYYGFGYGFGPSLFWGWYWDDWGWGDPYPYPYGGYGYGYGPGRGYYGGGYGHYTQDSRDDMGALDLDLSPGDTEVYVNGERIGTVDDFDGWPQYLWLPKGTYDLVFYRDGYKTLARQVSVYPGLVIDMDDSLEKGPSVRPEELQTKTHERRDDRMRYERDRGERIDRGEWDSRRPDDENWRDRSHHGRQADRDRDADRDDQDNDGDHHGYDAEHHGDDADHDAGHGAGRRSGNGHSSDAGWLRLSVAPDDASIYIDGRFVGTGSELSSMRRGLRVDPGQHHLAVVRPGHKPEERDFQVTAGGEAKLSVNLDKSGE